MLALRDRPARLVFGLCALSLTTACGPKKSTLQSLAVEPFPGRACQEVSVGVNELEVTTQRVGCTVHVQWDLVGMSTPTEIVMPVPSDMSGPVVRTTPRDTVSGRRVSFGAPGLRSEAWRIDVEDRTFGDTPEEQQAARTFRIGDHRYLVVLVRDTSTSGAVYPFPLVDANKVRSTYANDPGYCRELADAVHLYAATPEVRPQERVFDPEQALPAQSLVCSATDSHVFLVDLGPLSATTLDVVAELALRVPRIVRVQLDPQANYTVLDLTVMPVSQ